MQLVSIHHGDPKSIIVWTVFDGQNFHDISEKAILCHYKAVRDNKNIT